MNYELFNRLHTVIVEARSMLDDKLKRSTKDNNVYTPAVLPEDWEYVE